MPRTKSTAMKDNSLKKRVNTSASASANAKKRKNLSTAEVKGQTPGKKASARRDIPLRHQMFEKKKKSSTINNSIVEKLLRRWVAIVPCQGISKRGMHEFNYNLYRKSEDFPSIDRKPARLILNHRYKVILANFVHRLAILASHRRRNTISEKDVYMAMKFDEHATSHLAPKCIGFGAMTNHLFDSTDKSFLEKDPKVGDRSRRQHRLLAKEAREFASMSEAEAEARRKGEEAGEAGESEGKSEVTAEKTAGGAGSKKKKTSSVKTTKSKSKSKSKTASAAKSVTFMTDIEDENENENGKESESASADMASLVRKAKSKKQ